MASFPLSLNALTQFVMDNPGLRLAQGGLMLLAVVVLFLLFFALRDILLRTRSFWYQFVCIVIVTLLPVIGFLVYLLIRPARTIKERELEAMVLTLLAGDLPDQVEVGEVMEIETEMSDDDSDDSDESDDSDSSHKHV